MTNKFDTMGKEKIIEEFGIDPSELKDSEILFSAYEYECYSGEALVIFKNNGKIYEVQGYHCSCYGLEGQWEAEETSKEALQKRDYEYCEWNNLIKEFLTTLENSACTMTTKG